MDVIFVTTAKTDEEARELLTQFNMPFNKIVGRKYFNGKNIYENQTNKRKQKFSTREYNRCRICGRPHAYLRKYGICRVCFRELAYKGQIPGVKKASW